MKKILPAGFFIFLLMLTAQQALAHAVVSPNQANVGQFINFSLGVPSEKPIATVGARLLLPPGLSYVTPFVKPGWKITVKKQPAFENGKPIITDDGTQAETVSEIDWSGGLVPAGEKDLFMFSAQVPAQAATLNWKAYQSYADGSVVSWDQDPNTPQPKNSSGQIDFSKLGPYSKTQVTNDLAPVAGQATRQSNWQNFAASVLPLLVSIGALLVALWAAMKKN